MTNTQLVPLVSDLGIIAQRHGVHPVALLDASMLSLSRVHEPGILTDDPAVVWESYLPAAAAHAEIVPTHAGLRLRLRIDFDGEFRHGGDTAELARVIADELPAWVDDVSAVFDTLRGVSR